MAKIRRGEPGFTVSNARVKRGGALPERVSVSGVVAAVADIDTRTVTATHVEVPSGSVAFLTEWIGNDTARAEAARDHDRAGVRRAAAAVLGD